MPVAHWPALEVLMHKSETCAARRRFESRCDFCLMPAPAAGVFPSPGEDEASRTLHNTKDAACRFLGSVGTAHAYAPVAVGSRVEVMDNAGAPLGRPPLDQLIRLGPESEQLLGRDRNQAL